ncbi:hypothetical protein J5I95_15395 [Candidatus Poribacteria bacterium]|nr:hypothetical protein [Candidatus Poribacteria bacterium]
MREIEPFALKFIVGILIILFSITGCSDMPYTGSVLTVHEVDRYLVSTDGNVVCFQDEFDATCLKLTSETGNGANAINEPAIHIYPEKRVYVFYHEGKPILRAVRAGSNNGNNGNSNGDNSGNNGSGGNNNNNNGNNGGGGGNNGNNGGGNNNGGGGDNNGNNGGGNNNGNNNGNNGGGNNGNNGGGNNNGNNNGNNGGGGNNNGNNNGNNGGGNNGDNPDGTNGDDDDNNDNPPDNSDDGHGWIIWIYYPEGTAPQNPPTLSESGVTVTINGKQLTDDDITGFAQFIGPNNEVGVQFFYETKSAELLDLQVRMEGVVAADDPVKFNINYLWNSQ